jgi:hypothetical protein
VSTFKQYIGDAVYADFDGYSIVLTTENGIRATNTVVLEPEVFAALLQWRKRLESTLPRAAGEP